ncbi:dimethyladenosine transferase 2, mitochondrial-like isoform X2 [Ornithodoros turicata]|uniref:dimethyladenosine transferase 2, mitochondrial-like isoform X2 n=1 Tax=Ornithodoros turicata TaxID=34597 RepID=UPI0031398258
MRVILKKLGSYSVVSARRVSRGRVKTLLPGEDASDATDPEITRVWERFPKILRRRTADPEHIYHVHSAAVELLVKNVNPTSEEALIFEANPGPGVLTKALLEAGIPQLRVFEKIPVFVGHLELDIVREDFLRLASISASDEYGVTERTSQLLRGVPHLPWKNEPVVRVVGTLSRKKEVTFLRFLLHVLPQRASIFAVGRIDFLLFISGLEYTYITSTNKDLRRYRGISVLYKLFFDIQVIDKVPRRLFLPLPPKWKPKPNNVAVDHDNLFLVRLTPRSDLFELLTPPERLLELVFFIRQNMVKRTAYVIPTLEKWIPGCGPRLIHCGVKVFSRMGDLSPDQMLTLFQQFSALSEYQDSPFIAAVTREMREEDPSYPEL